MSLDNGLFFDICNVEVLALVTSGILPTSA
jgi:hypothetical protein